MKSNDSIKTYIGVKIIKAEPMNLGEYNLFKGWAIPEDEDPKKEGYKVVYPDNYISWSPKEIFEEAYQIFCYSNLASTSKLMVSPDYKDRFRAEHLQLALRIKGLDKMLQKFREGTLEFTPTCSYELLSSQLESMKLYMICLEDRAIQENIELIMF